MKTESQISKGRLWTSYILQGIIVLMFLMGAIQNLLKSDMAVEGAVAMGYPEESVFYLGCVLLISTLLFALPKTSTLGAILLTAWLGGAVASHIIHGDPLFNTLFPVLFGILIWICLWLRIDKLRQLTPWIK